jgi:hypothetical protein
MGREETLDRLVSLLGCLPGVQVAWAHNRPEVTSIGMRIDSQESLFLLVRAAGDANTPSLKVELTGKNEGGDIRYVLDVPESLGRGHGLTPLEILGVFLARDLKALRLIPPEEADEMQRGWKAAVF